MARKMKRRSPLPKPAIEPFSLRVRQAAEFTGISKSTLYRLIGEGLIETVKVGRSTLITTASLKSFIAEQPRGKPTSVAAHNL